MESEVLEGKLPCDNCGSSDAFHIYTDGHGHCFSCETHVKKVKGYEDLVPEEPMSKEWEPVFGEHKDLKKRGLTRETCEKWAYSVGEYKGRKCQIANYMRDGELVGQKIRFPNKEFFWNGGKNTINGRVLFQSNL